MDTPSLLLPRSTTKSPGRYGEIIQGQAEIETKPQKAPKGRGTPHRHGMVGLGIFLGFLLASDIPDLDLKKPATEKCQWIPQKAPTKIPLPFYFWPADQEMRQPSHTENSQKMTAARQPDTPGGTVALSRPRQRGQGEASGRAPW